jgi:hypothetical protein
MIIFNKNLKISAILEKISLDPVKKYKEKYRQ